MSQITMLEFSAESDFEAAARICRAQGYGDSFAYTTSSTIPGLYLCPMRASQPEKVIVKTREFGFVVLQIIEDETPAPAPERIEWTRVRNDTNGNPRYVCHFLNLLTREELDSVRDTGEKYQIALARARKIGGRKFHNRHYGGGIVFQSYSIETETRDIARLTGRNYTTC